jgi:hypothetical protein
MAKKCTCTKCGKTFRMGYDGVEGDNGPVCDPCGDIERDLNGYAWDKGAAEQTYCNLGTGKLQTYRREDVVFMPKKG